MKSVAWPLRRTFCMVWQSALSLALSLSVPASQSLAGLQPRHLSHFVHPGPLTPRVVCAAILLVQSYQAPFPLVRPTFRNPILLLTACFPLSSHTPSLFSCVTLVLSTSDARLSWFSCPTFSFSRLAHSTPIFLKPDIPSRLSFFAHTFRIFAMPALPHPAPCSTRPLASPRLALPSSDHPPWTSLLASPLTSPIPLRPHSRRPYLVQLGPRKSSSRHPLGYPPLPTLLTSFSRFLPTLITPFSLHTRLAILSCQLFFILSYVLPCVP